MITRLIAAARPLPLATACGCAILAAAGCSSAGGSGSPSSTTPSASAAPSHASGNGAASPSQVLARAAAASRHVTTFTASLDIVSTGAYPSHLAGTLAERTKPTVLAEQNFHVTGTGQPTQRMTTLLTSKAIYLSITSLEKALGKPWVVLPFSALKSSAGANFAPLIRQLESNNPLALTQMLAFSHNVHEVGSGTVDGVPTTEYAGTYSITASLAQLGAAFRRNMAPSVSALGLKTASFHVWVDGQGQVRKLTESEGGSAYHVDLTAVITSINQPVTIAIPRASQVVTMPGL